MMITLSILPLVVFLLLQATVVSSFVLPQSTTTFSKPDLSSSGLHLSTPDFADVVSSTSHFLSLFEATANGSNDKGAFFFLFFAGSGGGVIGLLQIPKVLAELQNIRDLSKESGPLDGANDTPLKTGPLVPLFYPDPISSNEIRKVLTKLPSGQQIVANGKSTEYFATKGYVVEDDFMLALSSCKCSPIASYAAFQAITDGSGKVVSPDIVDEKIKSYKDDDDELQQFANDLQGSVITKLSSYATLAFLVFITFDLIYETGVSAFSE